MASSDHPWLQLPTLTQWEELAFDNSFDSQVSNFLKPPFDNGLFTDTLDNFSPSTNTTTPQSNNPTPKPSSHRHRRTVNSPRSESSNTDSTSPDTSLGPISQRRKSQNRASQRAFRQRRTKRFQALQSRVTHLEKQLHAAKVANRLLAQMNGLGSLEELRARMRGGVVGRAGRGEGESEREREPPACEEGLGFQTCDLPLLGLGVGVEGEYWDEHVLGEGGFEVDEGLVDGAGWA